MNGLEHIAAAFENARTQGRAALMPYFTLGYPTANDSVDIIEALASAGADLIELGIPFSDPLADGPVIQYSTQVALEQGTSVKKCLSLVRQLRERGVEQPLLLMGYVNPILAYGVKKFVADASAAGADGFIVPDFPLEEAAEMEAACRAHGCALVYLASPNAAPERLALLAERTGGFLYLVSLNGVTGVRDAVPAGLAHFVERARTAARTPLAVGFGIARPEQAAAVARLADGVIIGSAVINAVREASDPVGAAGAYLRGIRAALEACA